MLTLADTDRKLDAVIWLQRQTAQVLAQLAHELHHLGVKQHDLYTAVDRLGSAADELTEAITDGRALPELSKSLTERSDERMNSKKPQTQHAAAPTGNQGVDDVIARVEASTQVVESATIFAKSVPGLIDKAVQSAVAKGATADQLAEINQVSNDLKAKADALAQAVAANTPAAPNP